MLLEAAAKKRGESLSAWLRATIYAQAESELTDGF